MEKQNEMEVERDKRNSWDPNPGDKRRSRNKEKEPRNFSSFLLFLLFSLSLRMKRIRRKGGSGSQSSVEDSSQFLSTIFHPLSLLHLSMFSPIYFLVVSSLSLSHTLLLVPYFFILSTLVMWPISRWAGT